MFRRAKRKKVSKRVVFISGGIILLVVLIVFPVAVYSRYAESASAQKLAAVFGFPAVILFDPFTVFTAGDLQSGMRSLRQFYENQDFSSAGIRIDFTTEEGKKRLAVRERGFINKVIEDAIIEEIANENGIRVSDTEIDQNVSRKLHEYGTEARVTEDLRRLYGWDLEDFKKKVVKPALYKERVLALFNSRKEKAKDDEARKRIEAAFEALQSGGDFSDVARRYSDGSSAQSGGDVGWINLSQAEPELAESIQNLEIGKRSDVIETLLGFHIVEVVEKRKDSETTLYRVRQIIAQRELFSDWINTRIQETSVWVFLPEYEWNAKTGFVEFSDPLLKKFEEENILRQEEIQ